MTKPGEENKTETQEAVKSAAESQQSTTEAEADITGTPETAGTQSAELSHELSEDLTKETDINKIFEQIKAGKIDFTKFGFRYLVF